MKNQANEATGISRRQMMKAGVAGASWGLLGLGLPQLLFTSKAYGNGLPDPAQPDPRLKKYDAVIQCYMTGGPSQTDTFDPKAEPGTRPGDARWSPNNVFPTLDLGANDIRGNPIWVTENLKALVDLHASDRKNFGIGIIRSMHHGIGAHPLAQGIMNCYWQSPVGSQLYPSTSASFDYLLSTQVTPPSPWAPGDPVGLPAVTLQQNQGVLSNDAKGGLCPTALQIPDSAQSMNAVSMLSEPVADARYVRRSGLVDATEAAFNASHPFDNSVSQWTNARRQALTITREGKAAGAFDLRGVPTLTGARVPAREPGAKNVPSSSKMLSALPSDLVNLTLAQQLVLNGVPFISLAIGGNDTHSNNFDGVSLNWGATVGPAFSQMARNIQKSGKRVLVTFIGDFGRTPNTTAPSARGDERDGRDHWPSGFSIGFLSINQPAFQTTAVGDTGPDGMLTATTGLKDVVYPGAVGGMVYRAMGYDPLTTLVPTGTGQMLPPIDTTYYQNQNSPAGTSVWLAEKFGIV